MLSDITDTKWKHMILSLSKLHRMIYIYNTGEWININQVSISLFGQD